MSVLTRQERQEQTRAELVDAAERLFTSQGFHATSLDAVAAAAGYTKGAVYSNFDGKEDLFFAVYERRVRARAAQLRRLLASGESALDGIRAATAALGRRPDDGWMAVFFEFWAHVLRRPEHRRRFADLHRQGLEPMAETLARLAAERRRELPLTPEQMATVQHALGNGLQLERLTRPDEIDETFIADVGRMLIRDLDEKGRA